MREATFSGIARIKISLSDRELWIFRRKSNAFALPGQVLLPRQRKWMNTAFIPFGSSQNTQHTQAVSSIWNCSSGNAHLGSNCGLYSLTSRQILRREWHRRTPEISIGVLHPYFIDSVRPGRLPYHQAKFLWLKTFTLPHFAAPPQSFIPKAMFQKSDGNLFQGLLYNQ